MGRSDDLQRFEQLVMPHFAAGYSLARWLTRDDADAADVMQEACLRALNAFGGYRGGDPRAWLLAIVRNASYSWLRQRRSGAVAAADGGDDLDELAADDDVQPDVRLSRSIDRRRLQEALEALPPPFREAIVLRELEGFSYKEIADIVDAPLGTVMSRLARARRHLQQLLLRSTGGD